MKTYTPAFCRHNSWLLSWPGAVVSLVLAATLVNFAPAADASAAGTAAAKPGTSSAPGAPAASEMRSFTNKDGKTLVAQIVSVTGDTVYLKRDDGGAVKSDIALFGDSDQAFIRKWTITQILQGGKKAFDFSITSNSTPQTVSYTGNASNPRVNAIYNWEEGYTVKLANLQSLHLVKPIIEYNIDMVGTGGKDNYIYGRADVDEIPASPTFSFDTTKLALTQHKNVKTGAPGVESKLTGIWVRIYDQDRQLIQEWSFPSNYMKTATWVRAPTPRGGRGGRGAGG